MARKILAHHAAWLGAHPKRTLEWLWDRLRDGFDVHHLDLNHANNDPDNLVLIEASDHWMLHCGVRLMRKAIHQRAINKAVMSSPAPAPKGTPPTILEEHPSLPHDEAYRLRQRGMVRLDRL